MIFDDASDRLDARGSGDKRAFRCPAHDDQDPSAELVRGEIRWFVNCYAGCTEDEVLAAAGIPLDEVFYERAQDNRRVAATYVYVDEQGAPIARKLRYLPKSFSWQHPQGDGWAKGYGEKRPSLYHVDEVLAGVRAHKPIWEAEGEKDVDRLRREGVIATCNPEGAAQDGQRSKWRQEYSELLRGATVVVVRDRDQAGKAHAQAVVDSVRQTAKMVLLVEPAAGKDASDHFAAGKTLSDFVVIETSATVDAPPRPSVLDLLIDLSAVPDEPPRFIIEPYAAEGYLTELVGKRGTFKSFVSLVSGARCHALALGHCEDRDLAGLCCAPAITLIVDGENGPYLLRNRYGVCGIDPAKGPLVADGTRIRLPKDMGTLRELIVATGAKLVILDALRRLTPGLDEDSSKDMAPVIADLATIARELQVAMVLLHHQSSKPGAPPSRGSSAIEDQVDVVMRLKRYPGNRLKLWVGEGGKYRIAEEPEPLWLDFSWVEGKFTLGVCEAVQEAEQEDAGPNVREVVAGALLTKMRSPSSQLPIGDGEMAKGWTASDLARAVGRKPKDNTVTRALSDLLALGLVTRGEDKRWRLAGAGRNGAAPQNAIDDDWED